MEPILTQTTSYCAYWIFVRGGSQWEANSQTGSYSPQFKGHLPDSPENFDFWTRSDATLPSPLSPKLVILCAHEMKYLCPDCERLVEPSSVHVAARTVELHCPKCGAVERLDSDDNADGPTQMETPRGRRDTEEASPDDLSNAQCPKCLATRGDESACSRCGLVYERWSKDAEPKASAGLIATWRELQDHWRDQDAHDRFVQQALQEDTLAYAARCYRSRDDRKANDQLEKITLIGVQAMQVAETPSRLNPKTFRVIGWVLFVVLCLSLAAILFTFR